MRFSFTLQVGWDVQKGPREHSARQLEIIILRDSHQLRQRSQSHSRSQPALVPLGWGVASKSSRAHQIQRDARRGVGVDRQPPKAGCRQECRQEQPPAQPTAFGRGQDGFAGLNEKLSAFSKSPTLEFGPSEKPAIGAMRFIPKSLKH